VAYDDFGLNLFHLAGVDREWLSPSQEEAFALEVVNAAKVELVLASPDTRTELGRRMADFLTQLSQGGVPMRLTWGKTSAGRDPDRTRSLTRLNLLEKHSPLWIEQHYARGVSRDCSIAHRFL